MFVKTNKGCMSHMRVPSDQFTKKYFRMKKVGIVLSILFITALLMTSCRSQQKCAAYAQKVDIENTKQI